MGDAVEGWGCADTPVGLLTARWSSRGVCAVDLGPCEGGEEGRRDDAHPWLLATAEAVASPHDAPDVPIDLAGTAFQRRVWRALQEIPAGETRTYAALAASLSPPSVARAVGAACGANRIAVLVPCHRVVAADGGLAGFRWGLACKRALQEREARQGSLFTPPTPRTRRT